MKSKQALYLLITGLFLLITGQIFSQNVFQKTYGGTAADYSESIRYLSDGGFVLSGTTASYGTGGTEAKELFIGRYNVIGLNSWTAEAGTNDKRQESQFVIPLSDGGFWTGGRTFEAAVGDFSDSWLTKKYSGAGANLHERMFGKTSVNAGGGAIWDDELLAAMEMPLANNVAMLGFTTNYGTPNEKEITFCTYNITSGMVGLTRHFGRPSFDGGGTDDIGRDLCEDAPGIYTIVGNTPTSAAQGRDFIAMHLAPFSYDMGAYRTFGGTGSDEAWSITKCADGGYLLVGYSNSPGSIGNDDFLVIKTDVNFNLTWSRMIGGTNQDRAYEAAQTSDGGFIIVGSTLSFGANPNVTTDMMVVKLTSGGLLSWAKCYGGTGNDEGRSVSKRPDGGFYFSGSCNTPISPAGNGQDIYVVATNSIGYSGGCNEMVVTPTFNNTPTINTSNTGMTQVASNLQIDFVVNPLTQSTTPATMTCKCENFAPNEEITGDIEVCRNSSGQYWINRIPGYTNYSWTITGATFSPAPAATDTLVNVNFTNTNAQIIVSTAGAGCNDFVIDTITIAMDNIATVITTPDSMLCIGDNTNLTAVTSNPQGAITGWVWTPSGPNNALNNVSPGLGSNVYSVTVTDTWGCTAGDVITVQVFSYPVVNIGPNDTVCNGGPVLLNATTPGGTYLWSTTAGTPTINAATSGTYWVDVSTNGCTTRDSIILGISTNPIVTISGDDSLCIGDATTLTANPSGGAGGYTFFWSGGLGTANSITQSPVINTTYTVTVTEAFGCTGSTSQLVNVFPYPSVNLGPDSNVCNGTVPFITLDAQNPGAGYTWSTTANTQTINVATSGTYWVDVNTNGCVTRDSVQINFSTNPTAGYTGITSICIGSSTTMYGNGSGGTNPLSYTWSQGPTTADSILLSPLITTPYSVITSDVAGCSDTAFFTITVNPYPVVDLGPDTVGCIPAPVTLNAPATPGTILWSTGASTNSISVPAADTVWLDITENGCTTRDSVVVDYYPLPSVNLGPDTTLCSIQNLVLDATNVYATYVWNDATTNPTLAVAQTNLYWVDVTSCGITVSDSIMVYMDTFSVYVVSLVPNECGSNNGSLTVASTSIYPTTYIWSGAGSGTNPALTNIAEGMYIVTATDSVGCIQTENIQVVCNIPSIEVTQLVTPNGDGKNDTWIIHGINNFPNAVVVVYNRWGNEVYRSIPYNNDWDGKSNSSISLGNDYLPAGTYYYVVDVFGDGSDVESGYLEFQP